MNDYKPLKIKRKRRSDPKIVKMLVFRIIPIALVVVISVCAFALFDKKISEIIARQKMEQITEIGPIDDPTLNNYTSTTVDWMSVYSASDPDGFDPLQLSPLGLSEDLRPSDTLVSNAFEKALGYTNKQSKIWSLHTSVNEDIVAWIYMPGLGINYPVAEDPKGSDFYLTHSYDKTYSTSGTIFLSNASSINPLSRNLILHGHNMRDNTMFATLANYLKGTPAYYDSHKYIFIDTLYGTYRYEIYSVYKTFPEDIYLRNAFESNESFLAWCSETNSKGLHRSDATSFTAADRILTLSTCDSTSKYRIIVHAKMVYPVPTDDIDFSYSTSTPTPTPDASTEPEITPEPNEPTPDPDLTEEEFAIGSLYRVSLDNPKSTLRLRSGPGTTYTSISGLANGTEVTINGVEGDWVKVTTSGGMQGYLLKTKLKKSSDFSFTVPDGNISAPTSNVVTPTPAV